jgi:hypothetical protein
MVKESGRGGAAKQARQHDLPAGGREQVFAAHDQIDVVAEVIDRHAELVRPVAGRVPQQQIARLLGG